MIIYLTIIFRFQIFGHVSTLWLNPKTRRPVLQNKTVRMQLWLSSHFYIVLGPELTYRAVIWSSHAWITSNYSQRVIFSSGRSASFTPSKTALCSRANKLVALACSWSGILLCWIQLQDGSRRGERAPSSIHAVPIKVTYVLHHTNEESRRLLWCYAKRRFTWFFTHHECKNSLQWATLKV
jgi:hypothetical protein